MNRMSRMDKLAWLNSEVCQELEQMEKNAQEAQPLDTAHQDKLVEKLTTKMTGSADDDGEFDFTTIGKDESFLSELTHSQLSALIKRLNEEKERRAGQEVGEDFNERICKCTAPDCGNCENFTETTEDDFCEECKRPEHFSEPQELDVELQAEASADLKTIKAELLQLAHEAADDGNTEAAYLIERFIQKNS